MTQVPLFYALLVVCAGTLCGLTLWARVRRSMKVVVLACTACWFVVAYVALVELLSRPKPVSYEFARAAMDDAEVLAGDVVENEAIFVWLRFEGLDEPRSYALPFDRQTAEQLRDALAERERSGSGVRMRLPFEPSLDDEEPRFYALPQPRLPYKPVPNDEPLRLEDPGRAA